MATGYHFHVKFVSRGKGQSVIAKASYNSRQPIKDEKTGELKDYSRGHSEVLFSGIFAPKDAPAWARDRAELWNAVNAYENRKNSQLAREIDLSFPHQLDEQQREWMVKDFVRENFVRNGMVADVNIHAPDKDGDERNYHAHILLTLRAVGPEGFDSHKNRDWNSSQTLNAWRAGWADKCAQMLTRGGHPIEAAQWRFAHLPLGEQRDAANARGDHDFAKTLNAEPGIHLGPHVAAMMAKGMDTDRGNLAAEIAARNQSARQERAPAGWTDSETRLRAGLDNLSLNGVAPIAAGIEKGAGKAAQLGEDLGEAAFGFFDGIGGVSAPSADDLRGRAYQRENDAAKREAANIDLSKYLYDEDYRERLIREQAARDKQQREQDEHTRRNSGRDR